MRPVRLFLLLTLWLLLSACSPSQQPLPLLSHDAVILAFGDSLTYGSGAAADQSYPAILEAITGRQVINAGVPGEISATGLERLPGLLDRYRPDLLLLCHGGNDMLRRQDIAQMENNLQQMIQLARERDIPVVLLSVPAPSISGAVLGLSGAAEYRRLARANGIPLEEDIIARVLSDQQLKSDQIHPNAAGYRQMAEAVYSLLQKAGAL